MKKILLATSALVMFAGAAAAEVTTSGSARMGIIYDGSDTWFSSRVRIAFSASGESDAGFSFGASVRADQVGNGNNTGDPTGTKNGDSTVWVSGGFGKLTMGDTGNAADSLVGQVSGVGYTGLFDLNEIGFLGKDITGAQYEYSTGALTFALGSGQLQDTDGDATNDDLISVAVKYAADTWSFALGWEDHDTDSQISALGSATFGGATVKLKLVDRDSEADMATALSVDYTTGATTITAYATDNVDFAGTDTMGLGASYDLGGGASVAGGVADNGTDTVAELGLNFSF